MGLWQLRSPRRSLAVRRAASAAAAKCVAQGEAKSDLRYTRIMSLSVFCRTISQNQTTSTAALKICIAEKLWPTFFLDSHCIKFMAGIVKLDNRCRRRGCTLYLLFCKNTACVMPECEVVMLKILHHGKITAQAYRRRPGRQRVQHSGGVVSRLTLSPWYYLRCFERCLSYFHSSNVV